MICNAGCRNANYRQAMEHFAASSGDSDATLFFCGDLNYRLSCGRAHAYSQLQGRDLSRVTPESEAHLMLQGLLVYDELLLQRKTDGAFGGFSEARISFFPTFKFDVGCNVYVDDRVMHIIRSLNQSCVVFQSALFHMHHPNHFSILCYFCCANIHSVVQV